jgi:enoyl-CoA hydratase
MSAEPVLLSERDGPVAILTLHRPRAHNALNKALLAELDRAIAGLSATPGVRCVVITGHGDRAFSAGADLTELTGLSVAEATDFLAHGQRVFRRIETAPVPVVAAVNGLALGGGFELVLACTFPVLAARARLALPEAGLGLMPGYGGTQRLARRTGTAVAAHVMLTGEHLDAGRAHQLGITPVPPVEGDVLAAATETAHRIAHRGPRAVRAILTALHGGPATGPDAGLALETALAAGLTSGAEAAEGIAAFRERREPSFDDLAAPEGAL